MTCSWENVIMVLHPFICVNCLQFALPIIVCWVSCSSSAEALWDFFFLNIEHNFSLLVQDRVHSLWTFYGISFSENRFPVFLLVRLPPATPKLICLIYMCGTIRRHRLEKDERVRKATLKSLNQWFFIRKEKKSRSCSQTPTKEKVDLKPDQSQMIYLLLEVYFQTQYSQK